MADKGSVFSKGGGGTNFEQYIQTAFLTTMLTKGNVPGINDSKIKEIALQATRLGYKTDDLFLRCSSHLGEHRVVAQIKHEFSFTTNDETFHDVISQLWSDFSNQDIFNQNSDKLLIIKENLNKSESNNVKSLINWAKSKSSASDFFLEVRRINKKESALNVFKTVIEKVKGESISEEEIWSFFKCLELLAYDFGNHDSTHKAYFLSLIKLSKNTDSTLTEGEIWAQLYEFISLLNKDGGLISLDSLVKEPFYKHFELEKLLPFYSTIDKLHQDSNLILNQLSNEIHGFHIDRFSLKEQIVNSINNHRLTIITGNPGVGKSAIIKDVLTESFKSAHLIVFRADQLNEPHLSNVFTNLGINNSIEDILSCISLIPQKIIFIDSIEKLLEGDSENAFKQLYNILNTYPDIKIVAASRKYAIDLLYFKYNIDKSNQPVEIATLSETELKLVENQFPQITQILSNKRIKQLLVSPKYIDYALTLLVKDSSDYSKVTLIDFKNKLWNHIVENVTKRNGGMPRKRGVAFTKIAVDRAKKMRLFIEPDGVDENAIDELENDNIIFKDGDNYSFSPSHDILEDWALVRYVRRIFGDDVNPHTFFNKIGNEPAIRRAFRLWVEDSLVDEQEKIIDFVDKIINANDIGKFWADEILIAIFKSENAHKFVKELTPKLIASNYDFLIRCIHLIRTTCKESGNNNSSLLIPIGSGWGALLEFISNNISDLDSLRDLIINFLMDWAYKIYREVNLPKESQYSVNIIIHYLNQTQSKDEFWFSYHHRNKYDNIIVLAFNLLPIANDYVLELLDKSINFERNDDNWKLRDFYEKVRDTCLSGLFSRKLVKEFPDKVSDVAWKAWKYVQRKPKGEFDFPSSMDTNEYFGLKEHIKDFPAGIYKTPFYNMLWSNTYKAFDFITEFCNYCVENYSKSDFAKDDDVVKISIKTDSKNIEQIGSYVLWQSYRGTGKVTPDVFRSILISLEKYLIEIAKFKNATSKKLLKHYFFYLLERSNNVAITSVLNSLCLAFPEELEECLLPILSVKEFYHWDSSRAFSEHQALAPMDNEISFAQKEMWEHNQLEHRKKYQRGLYDFVINYQFNIRILNKELHQIFDNLKNEATSEDIVWKKTLFEIDVRNWEVGEYSKEAGGITIQPKYQDEIKEFVDSNKPEFDEQNIAAGHSGWAYKKFKNEEGTSKDFINWENAYNHLCKNEHFDYMFDKPATLAHIGLRDYSSSISKTQKRWCVKLLIKSITEIYLKSLERYSLSASTFSPMDREPSLSSFSLILKNLDPKSGEERELAILLAHCLLSPIANFEKKHIIEDFRDNIWQENPKLANSIWLLLINYASLKKTDKKYVYRNPQSIEKERKEEHEFISKNILKEKKEVDKIEFSFETHIGHYLMLAIFIIPYDSTMLVHMEFIKAFIQKYLIAISEVDRLSDEHETMQLNREDKIDLNKYLSKYLLIQDNHIAKEVLNCLLNQYYLLLKTPEKAAKTYETIERLLNSIICELDFFVKGKNVFKDYSIEFFISHFWVLWENLKEQISNSRKTNFSSSLFLDFYSNNVPITWDETDKDWLPLVDKEDYFVQVIEQFGYANIRAILNIFVSIGHSRLLPNGLKLLVKILREHTTELSKVVTIKGEHFIENLFHSFCTKIKEDKSLLDDYIWLLDNMVDLGSSRAYLIRDNVITYKSI